MKNPSPHTEVLQRIISEHREMPGALLPILHAIQHAAGCIPAEAVPLIAEALNLSRAEVHGVISYYPDFRQQPGGRHVVRICCAEACQAVGAEVLGRHARAALDCDFKQTTADMAFSLEPVYCLGQCAVGPAVMIDDKLHARVTPEGLDILLGKAREAQ
ncbi:formate dehydrogenase subunit gamma [Herbaspirillum sp. ST 5-3]|uniref:formate dehydrogenase subunit gamma n=1 Tax=Oxalobacteraceae TaxID=75682 RepID=UPI0010A2DA31|nr:formate dehydrogenase subunit gamma [Herbaspirillum sp. ST 5-3]